MVFKQEISKATKMRLKSDIQFTPFAFGHGNLKKLSHPSCFKL